MTRAATSGATSVRAGVARALSALVLATLVAVGLVPGTSTQALAADLPSFEAVRAHWRSSDAWLLDRHGEPLHRLRVDATVRRADWVPLEDISPALVQAVLLSEDRRFMEHEGVDWSAIAGSSMRAAFGGKVRGASTLTMQLAGLLDATLARGRDGRTLGQKIDQALAARALEKRWRKDQVLEAYLNLMPLRGELVGADAAARVLFGKRPVGLDAREAALVAALLRGPNAAPDTVARRACGVLADMGRPEKSCLAMEGWARVVLARRGGDGDPVAGDAPQRAPHVARRLLREPGSLVRSTLDASVQRAAIDALSRRLAELDHRNVEDGAVLVLDNASGEVLAWVGSSGARSAAGAVDGVLAPRQAGSTLKPFVYALAIERRMLTAASLLDDSPLDIHTSAGRYVPRNYDRQFKGPVSVRAALGASLNVPAVRALMTVSPDALFERMRRAGFDTLRESGDWYGYSLALGSADVTLMALADAYRRLIAGATTPVTLGVEREARAARTAHGRGGETVAGMGAGAGLARPATPRPIAPAFDPAAAFVVADILADRNARAMTFGTENALATRGWAAVKTGTSKDMRDNWCIGVTDRYTVAVWVGNFSGEPMHDVSGTHGAAPVWADLVAFLHRGSVSRPPAPPPGLVRQTVRFDPEGEPPREEWFLTGTETEQVRRADPAAAPLAIARPADGSLLAIDPDIPPGVQRLVFEAAGADAARARWRLDGRWVGRGARMEWPLAPGPHRLELHGEGDGPVATVAFEVRGAWVRPRAHRSEAASARR